MPAAYIMDGSEGVTSRWQWQPNGAVTLDEEGILEEARRLFVARQAKAYPAADVIRTRLTGHGVIVECERDRVRVKW